MKFDIRILTFLEQLKSFFLRNKKPLILLYLTWGVYFVILWPKMLYWDKAGNLVAGWRIVWADWAMHLSQVNAFASQPIGYVVTHNPIFAGNSLAYPFFVNLLSGLLVKLGVNLVTAMVIPSMFFSLLLLFSLYFLGKTLTQSASKTLVALTLFLASGGLGFIYFIEDLQNVGVSLNNFLFPPHEYTRWESLNIYWYNTIVANFIPQRAFAPGMALALICLSVLFKRYLSNFKQVSYKSMLFLGLVTGTLSFIHTHSLIVVAFISAWLFIWSFQSYRHWFSFAGGAMITSLPFFLLLHGSQLARFIRWYPGWLANPSELHIPVINFWILNWGLFLPIVAIGFVLTQREKRLQLIYSGFLILFILCNLFIFQPYSWDNSKLLLYVYLFFAFPAADVLMALWKKHLLAKVLCGLLFVSLTASGALDLIRILNTTKVSYVMETSSDINLAAKLREFSDPTDIILTSDDHLNWVGVLSGRQIMMGYRGWLWSYGIDFDKRQQDIANIYQGKNAAKDLLTQYNIRFVVVDDKTRKDFSSNNSYYATHYPLLFKDGSTEVYRIQ